MDIVIHGTKGGCKIFTPKKISGLLDVSSDTSIAAAIGQEAYGIRFTADNTIFSKYKIIRDVRGDKRTGFVGFSIPIPKNKKLSGTVIFNVLEKVSDEYCKKYIVENNLNEATEDWTFLNPILDPKLDDIPFDNAGNMLSGDKDDSFIYFKDDNELQKYFDVPFQEEYAPYRQVLFINNDLQGKPENPLNALRHSENNLTGKIDLENPFYKLREFNGRGKNGVEIKIKNSIGRELHNNDKVHRKEKLTLVYSKKYYISSKPIVGSLLDSEELRKYLVVSSDNKIDIVKEIELEPETKTITFDVVAKKDGAKVSKAEIHILEYQDWKIISEYTFKDVELGKEYKILARKGDNLFSYEVKITPKDFTATALILPLIEKRIVKITVCEVDGSKEIREFKVWVNNGKCNNEKVTEVTFFDDEIYDTWNITVEMDGYLRSAFIPYVPETGIRTLCFKLIKDTRQTPPASNTQNERHSNNPVPEKQKTFAARAKIFFSKPAVIVGSVVGALVLGLGLWAWFHSAQETATTAQQSTVNVEGTTISLDTLNKIDEILKPKESAKKGTQQELKNEEIEGDKEIAIDKKNVEEKVEHSAAEKYVAPSNLTTVIIQYIKDSELDEAKLKEYQTTKKIDKTLTNSIQLCLDFWNLKKPSDSSKTSKTYCTLLETVAKDVNLKNSKLKTFLDKMCAMESPSYSTQDKKQGLKSI